jgi:hypothetical protein
MTNEDEIDRRLRGLPEIPLPPALGARVHARARAELEGARAVRFASLATATAVISAIAVYLTWAVRFLSALARG